MLGERRITTVINFTSFQKYYFSNILMNKWKMIFHYFFIMDLINQWLIYRLLLQTISLIQIILKAEIFINYWDNKATISSIKFNKIIKRIPIIIAKLKRTKKFTIYFCWPHYINRSIMPFRNYKITNFWISWYFFKINLKW